MIKFKKNNTSKKKKRVKINKKKVIYKKKKTFKNSFYKSKFQSNKKNITTYKRKKINKILNRFYMFKMSIRKRVSKIKKYVVYGFRSNYRWGHKTFYKLAKLKINKIASPVLKNSVLNLKFNSNLISRKVNLKKHNKLTNLIKNEKENTSYIQKLKYILYRRHARLAKHKKVAKRNSVLQALKKLDSELEFNQPIYLMNEGKKNAEVIIKNETGKSKIIFEKKSLKAYKNKNFIQHFLKRSERNKKISENLNSNGDLSNLLDINKKIPMEIRVSNIKKALGLYRKNSNVLFKKFLNWNLKIKKQKIKSLKNFILNKKNKIKLRAGIKLLLKIKLYNLIFNNENKNINLKDIKKHFNFEYYRNIINNKYALNSIDMHIKQNLKKNKRSQRKFLLSRKGLYSSWNHKIYLKKRYHNLLTVRGLKNLNTLINVIQTNIQKEAFKKQKSNEKKVNELQSHSNIFIGPLLTEMQQMRNNMKYFMKLKIRRRIKVQVKENSIKLSKKVRRRAKKVLTAKALYKQRFNEYKELRFQILKQQLTAQKKEATVSALTNQKSNEIKNEIIIKLLLQLFKNKGKDINKDHNNSITIENLNKYIKQNNNIFENSEILTYIKAKLINEYLEKRELTRLKDLNKQLMIQYMEYSSIKFPKERIPANEFKELMTQYYTEKNKFTQIKKELKKNLVHYYLYHEKIKENNDTYQIKLPKKRIVVPSLRTMYQGIKAAIKIQRRKLKIRRYGKGYFKRKNKKKRYYNKYQKELRKQQREKIKRKKQLLKLKRKKPEIPKMGILKIKLKKRNMFLILCNRKTNKIEEQATAREIYYKISEARNDVQPELGKRINRRKTAIKDKGPIGRHISTVHFRLFILSLLFLYRAKYKVLDVEIEKKSRKKIVRIIRKKYWYPFIAQLGVFRRFKFIKNKPHGRMRKRKTKRR